jgi:hypothetical protein
MMGWEPISSFDRCPISVIGAVEASAIKRANSDLGLIELLAVVLLDHLALDEGHLWDRKGSIMTCSRCGQIQRMTRTVDGVEFSVWKEDVT